MVAIREGEWSILSIHVDNDSVKDKQEFQRLEKRGNELSLSPSGLTFQVQQATPSSAVLESRGQVFFADYSLSDEEILQLELSRPQFAEKIVIQAQFDR